MGSEGREPGHGEPEGRGPGAGRFGVFVSRAVLILGLVLLGAGPLRADEGGDPPPAAKSGKSSKANSGEDASAKASSKKAAAAKSSKTAKKKAGPRMVGPFKLTGSFDFQTIYDDNVFRYSDENLLEFRQGINPPKFDLDTYDDFILSPRLNLNFGRKLIGGKETSFRVGYILWQYTSNPHKSNSAWSFRMRQPTMGRDAVEVGLSYAPWAHVRQLSDRPPFTSRIIPLTWIPFNGTRTAALLAYSKRVSDRISLRLEGGRTWRFYNKPFMENDNWEWNGAGTATVTLTPYAKVAGKYAYSVTDARAADTVGENDSNTDDGDGSYERDLYQGSLILSPKWLRKVTSLELMGQRQNYFYTSEQPYFLDQTHTGREDNVTAFEAAANTKPLWGSVSFEAGYRYTVRRSSSATSVIEGAESIEEDKNYQNNRAWLGMSYPF